MAERSESGDGYRVLSLMIAGPALYGLCGWLLDQWLRTSWLVAAGIGVGLVASIYMVIARYGRTQ